MNMEYSPTFIGPTAKRDSLIYAKYALADKILTSIVDLSEHIKVRVTGSPDPIDIINVESTNLEIYDDINLNNKIFEILISIDGIGEKTAKRVLTKITNLVDLANATPYDFESIEGVNNKRAVLLVKGIEKYLQRNIIDDISR